MISRLARCSTLVFISTVVGCGGPSGAPDDATDAMIELPDGGALTDAGAQDSGVPDAGEHDAGVTVDGGAPPPPYIRASAIAGRLLDAGIDLTTQTRLSELPSAQRGAIMRAFNESLGVSCSYCHVEDFSESTPRKRIAATMWTAITSKLTLTDGSPLFCDSCHQGQPSFLDRSDSSALQAFMNTNFVQAVARRDGASQSCASCHGDPFVPDLLEQWATP